MNSEDKEIFDKINDNFRGLIRKLTCLGEFWGKEGALSLEKIASEFYKTFNEESYELLSIASSTYYVAGGNAGYRAKTLNLFSKVFWYWRGWRCLRAAEKLSDKFARLRPMEDMSLGELDTRACILNKTGRRNEALSLVGHGITKILTGQIGTKHGLCLFLIHEAEIITGMRKYDKENKAEKNYQQAMELIEGEVAIPALTRVRVLKSYGKFLAENKIDDAEDILEEALDLAIENHLHDQERKIKAIFKSFKLTIR